MKYTNIRMIMDKITRHPLLEDIPFETVVDYAIDFMRIAGIPTSFEEKTADIEIKEHRGELPCDYYSMNQVRLPKGKCDNKELALRYSTDSFHYSEHNKHRYESEFTYKIKGNCIFTAPLRNGLVEISYNAIPIDDDGYPLIPDNSTYSRALEAYIKKQWFTIQFDLGKINQQVMMKADQDYAWAVGQAQTNMIMPSIDEMEALANSWNTLIVRANDHRKGFRHLGTKEHLYTH